MIRIGIGIIFFFMIAVVHAGNIQKLDLKKTNDKINQLKANGSYKEAEVLAIQLINQNPKDVDAQVQLASVYYKQGDYASAKTLLEGAQPYYPYDLDIPELLNLINQKTKNQPKTKVPNNPNLPVVMTTINKNRLAYPKKLDPVQTQNKIKQLKEKGSYKEAEDLALQLIAQNPRDVDAQVQLASIYYNQKDYSSAKIILEGAQIYYPKDPDIPELLNLINQKTNGKIVKTNAENDATVSSVTKKINQNRSASLTGKPSDIPANATVFSPSNLQATNILNNIVALPPGQEYGPNQLGLVQQSIYGTSPYSYWDFTNLYYTRKTDFGMVLGSLNYASRFGYSAFQGSGEAIINFTDSFYLDTNIAYANNLNLFPKWTFGAEGYFSVTKDFQISLGDLYKNVPPLLYFNTYTGSLQKYVGDYLLIFRPYVFVPNAGDNTVLYTVSARKYFDSVDNSLVLTLGYGMTPDLADLQSIDFITIKERSAAIDYQFPLMNHRFVADIGLSYENQRFPSGFIRQLSGINAGIRARF
jgi:YaiO family outer membrane protein